MATDDVGQQGIEMFYFGCWHGIGHYFHTPDGGSAEGKGGPPTPWGYGVEKLAPHTMTQGTAALHHKDGWTALAVDDFTVDSRGNSKSVFCFHTILPLDKAIEYAEVYFRPIMERIGPITMAHPETGVAPTRQWQ